MYASKIIFGGAVARALTAPLYAVVRRTGARAVVDYESSAWVTRLHLDRLEGLDDRHRFAWLVIMLPEFRNLVHYRIRSSALPCRLLLKALYRPEHTLNLDVDTIGRGLVIQHGFATAISAHAIGEDCWINQQVTIGWDKAGRPTIGDRVRIAAAAVVIGDVHVGDDARIGANAIVIRDVPPGTTMVAPLAVSLEELRQTRPARRRSG